MKSDRAKPLYKKDTVSDPKNFPDSTMPNENVITRRGPGQTSGTVPPLELTVHRYSKDHAVYSNNETDRAVAGRSSAPQNTAPASSSSDLAANLRKQGMGWAKGQK